MTNVHVGIPKEQGNEDVTLEGEAQGDKGSGIIADAALESETCPPLMEVPEYLVLSKQRVHEIATGDTRFSELLTECGKLALVSAFTPSNLTWHKEQTHLIQSNSLQGLQS